MDNIINKINTIDKIIDKDYNKLLYNFIDYYKRLCIDNELQNELNNKVLELKYKIK